MTDSPIAPAGWIEALERGEADVAAGRIVSADAVLRRLRDTADQLEAKLAKAAEQTQKAS